MTSPGKKAARRARGHNGIGISAAGALVRTPSAGPVMTRLILAVRLGRAGCRGSDAEDVVQETCARWYALCWQQQVAGQSPPGRAGRGPPAASAWTGGSTARDVPS